MAKLQNVLETDDIVSALMDSVTVDSLSAMASQLASVATQNHNELGTRLTNEVTRLDSALATALAAANKLEAYEKQQIEDILAGIIAQDGFQQLLESTCIDVNGEAKSLESVLGAIISAEKVTKTTMLTDADGQYNGAKLKLTTGTEAILNMARTVQEAGTSSEYVQYNFTTADWAGTGIPAGFYVNTKEINKSFSMFGVDANIKVGEKVMEQTNLVFDLTANLTDCSADITITAPDLDGDGKVGLATEDNSVL